MAAALVDSATSENLTEMDWAKNIEICELVAHDQRYTALCILTLFADLRCSCVMLSA